MNKKILVTGGAGFIGSFMTKRLLDEGDEVTVLDNLERGHKDFVDKRADLRIGDILNIEFMNELFTAKQFHAVVHFAGYISVGESSKQPDKYFKNNTLGSLMILEQMRKNRVKNIIFSSTAAVYGNPQKLPIPEDHPKFPQSPYGESKLLVENGLDWYSKTFGINSVSLRYFNAAGGALDGSMGEEHPDETHIIPNLIQAVLGDKKFTLYGTDYETIDGTCVRDYIHVLDLVEAHILALKKLEVDSGSFVYNVGTGTGYTNKQIISMVEKQSGKIIKLTMENRRPGDTAVLVADNTKIKKELNFNPEHSNLETIIDSAIKWHKKRLE